MQDPFRYNNSSPEVIRLTVMKCSRYSLSLRQVEDLLFVRISGEKHYPWRAVDHQGEVLEVFATKRRDRRAALKYLKRTMKRYGRPWSIVTGRLRSYGATMKVIGNVERREGGRWLDNRAEYSHLPFRRRGGTMARFRDIKTLQKFASFHASIHNHIDNDRHLYRRDLFKKNQFSALAELRASGLRTLILQALETCSH